MIIKFERKNFSDKQWRSLIKLCKKTSMLRWNTKCIEHSINTDDKIQELWLDMEFYDLY